MKKYKEAFERLKTFCNSDNGYPYNQFTQSSIPRNKDLEIVEKALEEYSKIENEIEEMAKVLTVNEEDLVLGNCEKYYPDCRNCAFIKYKNNFNCNCIDMCRAKVLFNAGYRKVNKKS